MIYARRLPFSRMVNARDLGGYPAGSTYTQFGRFIRSDVPSFVSSEDLELLSSFGINTIIDLRTEVELAKTPCAFASIEGYKYYNYSLGAFKIDEDAPISHSYLYLAQTEASVVREIMQVIAEAEGGVLYHCTAGKDRTGLISALILSICGVSLSDIIADYQVTYTYNKKAVLELMAQYPDFPAAWARSDAENMEGFMELLCREYGCAENYLLDIGVTRGQIDIIRGKLLTMN